MELSLFLAKLFGLYLFIVCLAVLYNRDLVPVLVRELGSTTSVPVFSGAILLILGLLVTLSHNVWSADWRVIITFLGWLTLLKGCLRLFLPQEVLRWGARVASGPAHRILLVVFLVIGLYLVIVGFTTVS